jgi:septum formation protein
MPGRLVLASTSRYRAELLGRLGLPFETSDPAVDEARVAGAAGPLAPRERAALLARAKAVAVASRLASDRAGGRTVVIGSDQVCALEREVLSKPGTSERACATLARLAGRTHELFTAVCLVVVENGSTSIEEFVDTTRLTMRALDAERIARYVARDEPLDCAGAYKVEAAGIALFERIDAVDHTAIVGLPLIGVTTRLLALGFELP